jgi:hypothetical protein
MPPAWRSTTTYPADLYPLAPDPRRPRRKGLSERGRLLTVALVNLALMSAGLWIAPYVIERLVAP